MGEVKQIIMKNRTFYFYNNIIDLKDFESNLLKIHKKHYKGINICYIGYITIKKIDDSETISSANLLYLRVNHASEHIDEKHGNRYLIFNSTDENKEALKKYADVWDGIKYEIKTINGGKENDYEKECFRKN